MKSWISGLALSSLAMSAGAMQGWKPTQQEQQLCDFNIKARIAEYGDKGGPRENWGHMHHYCDCLRFYNRALSTGKKDEKAFFIQESIQGCDYVLNHTTLDFALRPELQYRKGATYLLAGNESDAERELLEALRGNPAIADAYLQLGDLYARRKQQAKALDYVSEGLRHAPQSKALKRRYLELGGKEPFPQPHAKPQEDGKPTAASKPAAPPEKPVEPRPPAPTPAQAAAPETPPAVKPAMPSGQGSPANPWCRFCPDAGRTPDPDGSRPPAEPTGGR